MTRLLAAIVAIIALGFVPGLLQQASADTVIDSATIENAYPTQLKFKLTAHADSEITDVTLVYAITGRNTSAIGKPEPPITPAKSLSTEVVLQVNSASSYIPVGSEFVYHWEVTTADGATFSGPEATFLFLPPNEDWQSVKGDFMTVYYHSGNQALAESYLQAGIETFDKMGTKLLQTELKQKPVKVILFDNERESGPARPGGGSGTFDAAVTTCGTKVTNDIVLVIPVSCGTPDKTDTLRHEFTHIINQTAGEGPLGKLPSWLDEGTAVNGQITPGNNFTGAFDAAVRSNRLLPFASMNIPSSDPNKVNLFYGQSYMMAKYLIDKGADKYAQFFATIRSGTRFDDALQQVYGFDLAGFEAEFRQANGLPAVAGGATVAPTRSVTPTQRAAATPTTRAAAAGSTSNSNGGNSLGRGTWVIIGVAVLFVLLAVLSLLVTMMLSNNRKTALARNAPTPPSPSEPTPIEPNDEWPRPEDPNP